MPNLNKDTVMCISIALRPSNGGTSLFNYLFDQFEMNWVYKAFKVLPDNISDALAGVRALGIRGCGVSMPHKTTVIAYLDSIDEIAKKIEAVNTILNENGKLVGFNTDYVGVSKAFEELYPVRGKKAIVWGAGGMAKAAIVALQKGGASEVFIYNRTEEKAAKISANLGCTFVSKNNLDSVNADLFFNATPIGMDPDINSMPVAEPYIDRFEAVADAVAMPSLTSLIKMATKKRKKIIPGNIMASYQSLEQFKIYTSRDVPLELVRFKMSQMTTTK